MKTALTTIPPALRATSLCTREALGDGGSAKNKIRAYDNPSGAARHLPLHKGGFGRRRKREK